MPTFCSGKPLASTVLLSACLHVGLPAHAAVLIMAPAPQSTASEPDAAPNATHQLDKMKKALRFVNERAAAIKGLATTPPAASASESSESKGTANTVPAELRARFEEFTRLADELSESMDGAAPADANTRKLLRAVVQSSAKWPDILSGPPPDRTYDFARKTALDAAGSCGRLAQKLLLSPSMLVPPALTTGGPTASPQPQ